jgi:hypothetical protein
MVDGEAVLPTNVSEDAIEPGAEQSISKPPDLHEPSFASQPGRFGARLALSALQSSLELGGYEARC